MKYARRVVAVLTLIALLVAPDAFAQDADVSDAIAQIVEEAKKGKPVKLGDLAELKEMPLLAGIHMTFDGPASPREGYAFGHLTPKGGSRSACLAVSSTFDRGWGAILAIGYPDFTFPGIFPALAGTPLHAIAMPHAVVVLSPQDGTWSARDMPTAVRHFFADAARTRAFSLKVEKGINVFGAVSLPNSGQLGRLAKAAGLDAEHGLVQGCVAVRGSDAWRVLEGGAKGDKFRRVAERAVFRSTPTDLRLPHAPRWLHSKRVRLQLSATSGTGIGALLSIDIAGQRVDLDAFAPVPAGDRATLSFHGAPKGAWRRPFGIKWLTLEDVRVDLDLPAAGDSRYRIALAGTETIGRRKVRLTTAVEATPTTPIKAQVLAAEFDTLTADDLVSLSNQTRMSGTRHITPGLLPTITLTKGTIQIPTSDDAGAPTGLHATGTLEFHHLTLDDAEVDLDVEGLAIEARAERVPLGKHLALADAEIEIAFAPAERPRLDISGVANLGRRAERISVQADRDGFAFQTTIPLPGGFPAGVEARSAARTIAFHVRGTMEDGFRDALETLLAEELARVAHAAVSNIAAARHAVHAAAYAAARNDEKKIDPQKKKEQSEALKRAIQQKAAELAALDKKIGVLRAAIRLERMDANDFIRAAEDKADHLHNEYNKANHNAHHGNVFKRTYYAHKATALWLAWKSAQGALKGVMKTYGWVQHAGPIDDDPRVRDLLLKRKTIVTAISDLQKQLDDLTRQVDAAPHPRSAALDASRSKVHIPHAKAKKALEATEKEFGPAARVAEFIAKKKPLVVRSATFGVDLATLLTKKTTGPLALEIDVFGHVRKVRWAFDLAHVEDGVAPLAAHLIKSL